MTDRAKMLESIVGLLQSKDQSNVDVGFLQLLNFVGGNIGKALQYYAKVMVVHCTELKPLPRPHPQYDGSYSYYYLIPFLEFDVDVHDSIYFDLKEKGKNNIDFEARKSYVKTKARHDIIWRGKEILEIIK